GYLAVTDGKGAYLFMGLAVLVIVGARLTDIVKLRFGSNGIEAEMERIRESLNELHVLSELFAKFSLTQMQGAGRWGGYNSSERARMRNMIVDGLRSIGVAERRIQKALEVEWPFMKFDYYYAATQAADRQRDRPSTENAFRAFFEARPQGIGNEPSPAELRVLFDQIGVTGGEANEALLDYFHFVETHTHRRSPI
ncbi:MAG: hypothetical protein J0G97_21905, partial [Rhizobium pusense]|nr:hypothetical protein [Agrobacterium pusense]